jgi:hypothetical protein
MFASRFRRKGSTLTSNQAHRHALKRSRLADFPARECTILPDELRSKDLIS